MPERSEVYAAIDRECAYAARKWRHVSNGVRSVTSWLLVIEAELAEAKEAWVKSGHDPAALVELLQVVACGVRCLEQHGVYEREELR